ncbi:MAG: response regulator [Rickettsiales bacterium]|nr:response regulator [Rickettsiales bacterium]
MTISQDIIPIINEFNKFVGNKLRAIRGLRGLTRLDLSEILGVSRSLVQQYENGNVRIPLSSILILSKLLDTPVHYFLDGASSMLRQDNLVNDYYVNINHRNHLNILIVENNVSDQLMLTKAIESVRNIETSLYAVHNSEEALMFLRNSYLPLPNIILLNLNSPKMEGLDLIKMLNNDSKLRIIPVIIMTNSIKFADLSRCYQHHISGYYIKSLDLNKLKSYIEVSLHYWLKNYTM